LQQRGKGKASKKAEPPRKKVIRSTYRDNDPPLI
jgi:hypothetical protein